MSKRIAFFLWGLGFFLFFVFFSYLVSKDIFTQFDFDTTVRLQDKISRRFDDVFSTLSDVGNFEIMFAALVALFVLIRKFVAGFAAIFLFVGFHLIEMFGKFFVEHAPPPHFLLRTKTIFEFPQFYVRTANSYPSGHAGRTMFLSIVLLILIWQTKILNKPLKLFLSACILGFDIVMLVSRVYLGEHWTTDVIGGGMLGAALGLLAAVFVVERKKKHVSVNSKLKI